MAYRVELKGPDRPALINVRVGANDLAAVEQTVGLTAPTPCGAVSKSASVTVFGLGPDEWLIRTRQDEEQLWLDRLEVATARTCSAVVLVSDAHSVFRIAGADALEVLAQATGLDVHRSAFPTGSATRTAFAKGSALIHRLDETPSFDLYFDSALTRYARAWLQCAIDPTRAQWPG
ncbi:MAG: sarcosine oxidase subunit gamma [Gammaproteobacteria bacterium]